MLPPIKHQAGTFAGKEDVMHVVISPEKRQFEQLGETLEERLRAFKELIRQAAQAFLLTFEFVELRWNAAIHFNTETPHAHLAISCHQ
jgi:hypothetical protein